MMMQDRKPRILLTGFTGQVGGELAKLAPPGYELVLAKDVANRLDLGDLGKLSAMIRSVKPSIIINPAAYTAVDKAEVEPDAARLLNVAVPELLATEAKAIGATLVHYSTDYVFSGEPGHGPWREEDSTGPVNIYGKTKLEGEKAIQQIWHKHIIFRTSWVYSGHGNNFMKTMLRLACERDQLKVVSDQIGAPTSAKFVASMTVKALLAAGEDESKTGLFHLTCSGSTSWHGFASAIIERARSRMPQIKCSRIVPIPSSEFPTPARRPENSVLDCSKFEHVFGQTRTTWESALDETLSEYLDHMI